jgi:hypothetical protein
VKAARSEDDGVPSPCLDVVPRNPAAGRRSVQRHVGGGFKDTPGVPTRIQALVRSRQLLIHLVGNQSVG